LCPHSDNLVNPTERVCLKVRGLVLEARPKKDSPANTEYAWGKISLLVFRQIQLSSGPKCPKFPAEACLDEHVRGGEKLYYLPLYLVARERRSGASNTDTDADGKERSFT
jgi:hypothetical protein